MKSFTIVGLGEVLWDFLPGGKQLGELATPMLYKIRFLSQGKKAPEITAADADGKEFKLSD